MEQENKKKEIFRILKYTVITASAGVIQFGSTAILGLIWPVEKFPNGAVLFYLIGLILSVVWNLTINRKYTFKSVEKIGRAVLLTISFYLVFAPCSLLLQAWLTNGVLIDGWNFILSNHLNLHLLVGTIICMLLNFGLEYPFQRFVVFGKSIDSAKKHDKIIEK